MSNSSLAALVMIWLIGTASAMAQESPPPTNDAQIVAIVGAANDGEIKEGRVAKSKASNRDVKAFADKMLIDHTRLDKSSMALASKMQVRPESSPGSEKLKASAMQDEQKLSSLSGSDFDKAYVEAQIKDHQTVLDTLDRQLIPNAKSAELKAELLRARPVIADHLQHAQQLQAAMGSSKK
jgi:putative membrane protein